MRFLADLALFVEVANTQNFGRAATSLGIPTSTLSRRIGALERELSRRTTVRECPFDILDGDLPDAETHGAAHLAGNERRRDDLGRAPLDFS